MSISKDKTRIAVSITKEQLIEFDAVAKEMGVSKSILMQIATINFVNNYKHSKNSLKNDNKE